MSGLSATEEEDFRECFVIFDSANAGTISIEDMGSAMRSMGQNPTKQELDEIAKEVDKSGSGKVDVNGLLQAAGLMSAKMAAVDQQQQLKDAFAVFDKDSNGCISAA